MGRPKQPIKVIQGKGKKHLTAKEIEERTKSEVHAPSDAVKPPGFLAARQKREFRSLAGQLKTLGIMSNLDCVALGQYIVAKDEWIMYTKLVESLARSDSGETEQECTSVLLDKLPALEKVSSLQDKAFKRCRSCATDLGLTISSRCRLVLPPKEEKEPDKNAGLFGDAAI